MYGIMLVDDEPAVLRGLNDLIDWQSLDTEIVATATSGQEALSFLQLAPVHILITDICMPQMDGLALISAAKALNPQMRCIIISAHDEFEYVRQALTQGVENYLLKPINSSELTETIGKTVANIQRAAAQQVPDALAFRTNILDRWVNSSIQDFELADRAALLQIDLDTPQYQAIVIIPRQASSTGERLEQSSALLGPMRAAMVSALEADVFWDRHANLAAIVRCDDLEQKKTVIASILKQTLPQGQYYASVGNIVDNAYSLGVSYRNAYAMLPNRFLDENDFVFCHDHPAMLEASVATLRFEQALDDFDIPAATEAASRVLAPAFGKSKSELTEHLLPLELKLLSRFNDSISKNSDIPEPLLHGLRSLRRCSSDEILDLFVSSMTEAFKTLTSLQNTMHPVIRRSLDMISSTYSANISLRTIAEELNINPSYFGQLFKAETGQLFNDYLTAMRLRVARDLLADTDKKIGEIISAIGIAQQSYFNRLFKQEYGITPVEYRRSLIGRVNKSPQNNNLPNPHRPGTNASPYES